MSPPRQLPPHHPLIPALPTPLAPTTPVPPFPTPPSTTTLEFKIKNTWDDMLLQHKTLEEGMKTGIMVVCRVRKASSPARNHAPLNSPPSVHIPHPSVSSHHLVAVADVKIRFHL